jgi:hypothetical protein
MLEQLREVSFIEQLNHVGYFRNLFKAIVDKFAHENGNVKLFWDDAKLKEAFSDWQLCVGEWLTKFKADMVSTGAADTDSLELSHIKSMGALLDCLTQRGFEPIKAARVDGILTNNLRRMVVAYPNEYYNFIGCLLIFNFQQREREIASRYDLDKPPLHFRYVRSMIAYLRQYYSEKDVYPRDETDFYMIFKTMDLYGLEEDYGNR